MGRTRILVIEDAVDFQILLNKALAQKFDVTLASSAEEAEKIVTDHQFDLLILDVELPGDDGFKFCAKFKAKPQNVHTPVFFLSNRNTTDYKVHGFELGADDYISKPFDPVELVARVEAKVRKSKQSQVEDVYQKGHFVINSSAQKISVMVNGADQKLDLTPNEFKILQLFIKNEDTVLTREKILEYVWGAGTFISGRTVDTHVYSLRKKLGDHSHFIKAVPKIGYRFVQGSNVSRNSA